MSHENMFFCEQEMCNSTLNDRLVDSVRRKAEPKGWRAAAARRDVSTAVVTRKGVCARVTTSTAADPLDPLVANPELLAGLSEAEKRALLSGEADAAAAASGSGSESGGGGGGSTAAVCGLASSSSSAPAKEAPGRAPPPAWAKRRKRAPPPTAADGAPRRGAPAAAGGRNLLSFGDGDDDDG